MAKTKSDSPLFTLIASCEDTVAVDFQSKWGSVKFTGDIDAVAGLVVGILTPLIDRLDAKKETA